MLVLVRGRGRGRQHRRRLRGGHDRGADRARRRARREAGRAVGARRRGAGVTGPLPRLRRPASPATCCSARCCDAGADPQRCAPGWPGSAIEGLELRTEPVHAARDRATHATVHAAPGQPHRDWRSIRAQIDAAGLPERPRARAQEAFRRLAHAEGADPRHRPRAVHFHEVGAVDAIGEVCGVALALEALGIDRVVCSPLPRRPRLRRGRPRAPAAARRPPRSRCSRARRSTASTSRPSSSRPPAPRSSPRSPTATARCRG